MPPEQSTWGRDAVSFYANIFSLLYEFPDVDATYICGDFNSRMGNKQDVISEIDNVCGRKAIDLGVNKHGTVLNEFLLDGKLCTVNGRLCIENDNFTFIDPRGRSVVDSFNVPVENMGRCKSISVNTARDMIDLYCNISEEVYNIPGMIPDHSVLYLEINTS